MVVVLSEENRGMHSLRKSREREIAILFFLSADPRVGPDG